MTSENLLSTLTQLADVLQTQHTLGGTLAHIAEVATDSVPRCDIASVALSIEGRPATAAATARVALELDMVQYDLHDGPCLKTFRNIETLRVDIVEAGGAVPHFARAPQRHGVRARPSGPPPGGAGPRGNAEN